MGRVGDMNTIPFKLLFTVAVMVWWVEGSGCTSTQVGKKEVLPQEAATLGDGEQPPSPIEVLIDAETFTAFCDRA